MQKRFPTTVLVTLALFLSLDGDAVQAQIPPSLMSVRDNPELVRQRIIESGMTPEQIRAQLMARGVPANSLDAFLSGEPVDAGTAFTPDAMTALQLLGVVEEGADGLEIVETISGMDVGERTESVSPVFGHDIFRRATSRFQPLLSGPVPDTYQLGPGDRLLLLLTGEVELAHDLEVTREGFVVVPELGRLTIIGLNMIEAETLLRERLSGLYSGIRRGTTSVSISISELRTIQIYVTGEARQPGAYQLSSLATVTNALYAADGPTDLGSLRDLRIRRRSGEELSLDLHPYMVNGDAAGDVTLEQGDVVFVPLKKRRVKLDGAVVRPKLYDLVEGDGLVHVLEAAGGFSSLADRRRLTVHRVLQPLEQATAKSNRAAINLALSVSEGEEMTNSVGGVIIPPFGLQDGDSIVVDSVPPLDRSLYVVAVGMVAQPDTFPWRQGMTLRNVVDLARGPTIGADLREAEITRLPTERGAGVLGESFKVPMDSSYLSPQTHSNQYAGAPGVQFAPPGTAPEFTLEPFDIVQIRQQPNFKLQQTVTVTGEVSVPGVYALTREDERLSDLISRSGDILPSGYPAGAQLIRSLDELGRMDIDLISAIAYPSGEEDVLLQPGDSLNIPVYSPTVRVTGAVNSPVTVLYRPDQDFEYYIAAAGGFRNDADESRASVRYASGRGETRSKFLLWSNYPEPDAGSVISVPAKNPEDATNWVLLIGNIAGVLASLATTVIVLTR